MARSTWVLIALGIVPTIGRYSAGRFADEPSASVLRPLVALDGRKSQIKKVKQLRITSADDWRALWREHQNGSAEASVSPRAFESIDLDFERVMAVAIFKGEGPVSTGVTAESIREIDGEIVIRLDEHSYQTGLAPDMAVPSKDCAWGILVLPRSNKAIVFERDVRTLIADPPEWKKLTRLPALPDNPN